MTMTMTTPNYFCDRAGGCVCGGDTPGVRAGCTHFHAIAYKPAASASPLRMVLHCPACGLQHIDAPTPPTYRQGGEGLTYQTRPAWTNPPHRSHLCAGCGIVWRPASFPTTGVQATQTRGADDSAIPTAQPAATRWRAEFEALEAFLIAREHKCDDGDALETYAQAEAVLTARLRIATDLDRIRESLTNRYEGQKRTGDRAGATATRELLEAITQKAPGL